MPVGVVGFNNLANELSKYGQGNTIRATGTLQEKGYTAKNGNEVDDYQILLDGIAGVKSAKGVRAKPKDNSEPKGYAAPHPNQTGGILFDEIPVFNTGEMK